MYYLPFGKDAKGDVSELGCATRTRKRGLSMSSHKEINNSISCHYYFISNLKLKKQVTRTQLRFLYFR